MTDFYITIFLAFVTGLAMGSFVTMASWRLPRGEEITFKPSHCPHCNATLTPRDLVPLVSWVMQRGRCRYCKASIGIRYPLTELSLGLAFALLVLLYGISWLTLIFMLLATELLILIVTDLEHYIIPDSIQIALGITGAVFALYIGRDLFDVLTSVTIGLSLGLSLHYGYLFLRKKDALGWGDVKFLAVAGLWLTPLSWVPFLFLAGVLGTLFGLAWRMAGRGAVFPFGPALAASLVVNAVFPAIMTQILL